MVIKLSLTELQKGILFEIKQFKERTYYINQELLCFNIALDVFLMQKAFEQLISKYEILRSAINFESYQPNFVIYEKVSLPFTFYDYSNFDMGWKNDFFNSFLEEDFVKPLDITLAPLMRVSIFKLAEEDYRIIWDIHHIIVDGASVSKIIKDLFEIYFSLLKNKLYVSSEVIPYYKANTYENMLDLSAAKGYWKQLLNNHEVASFLPCSSKKNTNVNKKGIKNLHVSSVEYQKLINFVKRHDLTLNNLFQATWSIVLSHYSNNENIIFGSVRAYPKDITQNYTGLFINTLPMSFKIDFNISAIEYLYSVQEQSKKLRDYVTVSLNKIHEWSGLSLDTPIYRSIINYEPFSLNKILATQFPQIPCRFSSRLDVPYPLILEIVDDGESLQLDLNYEKSIFDDEYMEVYLNHYKDILFLIADNPNKKLIEFPIVDETTFHKVVFEWNNTTVDYPLHKTIHQLFEEQVEKNPNAPAVVFRDEILTYKMLNERANQLAHYLLHQGIKVEDHVVIWLKPRPEMLVSILAVLKSGGAYVPIDANNPLERIKYILQDSQPKFVLTETLSLEILSGLFSDDFVKPLMINVDQPLWNIYPKANPLEPVHSTNLMYIIYTSGSTGKPKGSLIEHYSAANMALSCGQRLKLSSQSRVLQIASFSFDASVMEWGMTLLNGACFYIIDRDFFSPQRVVDALKQYKITAITSSHSILASLPESDLPDLKVIAPGGEPLNRQVLNYWGKDRLFLNVYGITEVTVASTMAECTPETETITIGNPLSNVQIYILNKHLQPLPPGITGEIYIGGYGVGRGYWNNLTLTQEKFIDNPFVRNRARYDFIRNKLYKTGDLGRWVNNGEVEFIGRIDDQIKLRGFRVEIQEIEHLLEQYQEIEKAIVVVKELEKTKQLIGYVLTNTNSKIDLVKLRECLNKHLPTYMVPAQIIQIDKLPLTTHGKIDKKTLLAMSNREIIDDIDNDISSQCEVTKNICAVMQKMLQRQSIPIHKNILDIGFDSIMLVELSMKLSCEFNLPIDITTLFTYTTVADLTSFIKNNIGINKRQDSFDSIKELVAKRNKH